MKRAVLFLFVFVFSVVVGHFVTLFAVPQIIMKRAMTAMEDRGVPLHGFVLSPRITPQTQTVVRPSPDLAYSICRFDLSEAGGKLEIHAAVWEGYGSISFFDARTNNFSTIRVGETGAANDGSDVLLMSPEFQPGSDRPEGEIRVTAPTEKGLILIRRLAPTPEDYARVKVISVGDECGAQD